MAIRFAGALVAALCFASPAAFAAEPYKWSGWYAGLNAGGNWGQAEPSQLLSGAPLNVPRALLLSNIASQSYNTSGFTGGVHAGYNWQLGNSLLVGAEVDFGYFNSAGSKTFLGPVGGGPILLNQSVSTSWLSTVRPRVGFLLNNAHVYGTGGLALTNLRGAYSFLTPANERDVAEFSDIKLGWTVGGGIEFAFAKNWNVGAEYLYVKFDSISSNTRNVVVGLVAVPTVNTFNSVDLTANIARLRLNTKF